MDEWEIKLEGLGIELGVEIIASFHDIKDALGRYLKLAIEDLYLLMSNPESYENYYSQSGLISIINKDEGELDKNSFFLVLGISLQRYRVAFLFKNIEEETYLVAIYPGDFLKAVEDSDRLLKKLLRKIIHEPWEWETVDIVTPTSE
ncbi:MAG: hypothetical protein ACP6IP_00975 [Candidatus Njordarchaeia archaeon]